MTLTVSSAASGRMAKVTVAEAASVSGGSARSESLTFAASTRRVQVSPPGQEGAGVRVTARVADAGSAGEAVKWAALPDGHSTVRPSRPRRPRPR